MVGGRWGVDLELGNLVFFLGKEGLVELVEAGNVVFVLLPRLLQLGDLGFDLLLELVDLFFCDSSLVSFDEGPRGIWGDQKGQLKRLG